MIVWLQRKKMNHSSENNLDDDNNHIGYDNNRIAENIVCPLKVYLNFSFVELLPLSRQLVD